MDLGFCQLMKRSSKRFRAGDGLLMYGKQKSVLTKQTDAINIHDTQKGFSL